MIERIKKEILSKTGLNVTTKIDENNKKYSKFEFVKFRILN